MSEKHGNFFSKYADHNMAKYAAKYAEIGRNYIFYVNLTWYVFDRIAII